MGVWKKFVINPYFQAVGKMLKEDSSQEFSSYNNKINESCKLSLMVTACNLRDSTTVPFERSYNADYL